MSIEDSNKVGDGDSRSIQQVFFDTEEEKTLHSKILDLFSKSTLNSENLGEYTKGKMDKINVFEEIKKLGLEDLFQKMQKKIIPFPSLDIEVKEAEEERLVRIFLKMVHIMKPETKNSSI
ncbi:MAG: hypothetical protein K9L98_00530 [Candidatus Pacebacteria bacterium]|nr:hypothetical protein [Candidatus Paceibacterota bacterium]MCF7862484.1 hypothetical protein [Candidatus Paceibacterota bacterium]